jgi:hypothetical protein
MGSLYIGGGQCKYAQLVNEDDLEIFDDVCGKLQTLADEFNVHIDRYHMEDLSDGYNFVISNKEIEHQCFFSGGAFTYDMNVEVSDTFEERAQSFIKAMEEREEFSAFHDLDWSEPEVVYFTVS